jgi:hypothetical protein
MATQEIARMSILAQLSSQVGDRSEYSNRKVVIQCYDDPDLLGEIAEGLKSKNAALVGDCAEVLTQIAESKYFSNNRCLYFPNINPSWIPGVIWLNLISVWDLGTI